MGECSPFWCSGCRHSTYHDLSFLKLESEEWSLYKVQEPSILRVKVVSGTKPEYIHQEGTAIERTIEGDDSVKWKVELDNNGGTQWFWQHNLERLKRRRLM